ncbi:MAG TPA: lipase family protein [Pseudonocardiaceae bacterium]|nr:lipase family protein [Pseudonocardiaceae bacterium]
MPNLFSRSSRGRARVVWSLAVVLAIGAAVGLVSASTSSAASPSTPAIAAASTTSIPPGPTDDSFYTPPSPLPTGNPGDIIRWRPATAGPTSFQGTVNAWNVMYLSTDANGKPDAVTGTVLTPKNGTPASEPIIGFAPGTQGMAFQCAPSKYLARDGFYEQPALDDFINNGYAVAITDYEGYQQTPKATYITGKSEGPALIDAVRAAQNLSQASLSATAKVIFRGYSQGGGAAMWAGQLQPTYAPQLNLVGVAGGGVPADLVSVSLALNNAKGFGFLMAALIGLDNAYNLGLNNDLNSAGQAAVKELTTNDCLYELITNFAGKNINTYFSTNPLGSAAFSTAYSTNKLGSTPPKVPVYDYGGTNDQFVAYPQQLTLAHTYCSAGVNLTWKDYPSDHIGLIYNGNADALAWIKGVLAGQTPASNCSSLPTS